MMIGILMRKFRKKPIVIEAVQFNGTNHDEIADFCQPRDTYVGNKELIIKTLEGEHIASVNDWIIKGVQGECYPCKPDIFEQTYEAV